MPCPNKPVVLAVSTMTNGCDCDCDGRRHGASSRTSDICDETLPYASATPTNPLWCRTRSKQRRRRRKGATASTTVAVVLTGCTVATLLLLSIVGSPPSSSLSRGRPYARAVPDDVVTGGQRRDSDDRSAMTTVPVPMRSLQDADVGVEEGNDADPIEDYYDFSSYSCGDILLETSSSSFDASESESLRVRCAYATTCNDHEGLLPAYRFAFCDPHRSAERWSILLSPFFVLALLLLFRMLGSTAEEYLSPSLQAASDHLALPPRFAGATLLALGNGAPDLSATVNAISSDPHRGWRIVLGALQGGGMFVNTVVAGTIIASSRTGVSCKGPLVRDIAAYFVAVSTVFVEFKTGWIGRRAVTVFFAVYIAYVASVSVVDLTSIGMRRRSSRSSSSGSIGKSSSIADASSDEEDETEEEDDNVTEATATATITTTDSSEEELRLVESSDDDDHTDDCASSVEGNVGERGAAKLVYLCSDENDSSCSPSENSSSVDADEEEWIEDEERGCASLQASSLRKPAHGFSQERGEPRLTSRLHHRPPNEGPALSYYRRSSSLHDDTLLSASMQASLAFRTAFRDIHCQWTELRDVIFSNDDNDNVHFLEKCLLCCELPFTIARKLTVPIVPPRRDDEQRDSLALVALSLALSPVWIVAYASMKFDVDLLSAEYVGVFGTYAVCMVGVALVVLLQQCRDDSDGTTPTKKTKLPLVAAAPIALYAFVLAASWIDCIGENLIAFLEFLGVVSRVPSTLMGCTILAWGNSMGDLVTNVTLSRKGLANMAMTACFAGPVFNLLIGLGWGFAAAAHSHSGGGGAKEFHGGGTSVQVSPSVKAGFIFLMCNCALMIFAGVGRCKGNFQSGMDSRRSLCMVRT